MSFLSASILLTELHLRGDYYTAYSELDNAIPSINLAETVGWQELSVSNEPQVDWISSHSENLT